MNPETDSRHIRLRLFTLMGWTHHPAGPTHKVWCMQSGDYVQLSEYWTHRWGPNELSYHEEAPDFDWNFISAAREKLLVTEEQRKRNTAALMLLAGYKSEDLNGSTIHKLTWAVLSASLTDQAEALCRALNA